ncbi:unnamed protein product [Microthlaspi erraticum]|uniref:Uncharacterized protein n=1 Tax=Microthlaspi erraticum TaxID=1685480 RepID=A0A6D2I9I1_9BRAS|nr:unnamed protein product [Microthlaspi erraticum]
MPRQLGKLSITSENDHLAFLKFLASQQWSSRTTTSSLQNTPSIWSSTWKHLNSLASLASDMFSILETNLDSVQLPHFYFDGFHGWFHSQRFLPLQKPCIMKLPLAGVLRNQVDSVISKAEGECSKKRFLVFDQSGDQTNLVLTSDIKKSFGSQKRPNIKEDLQRSKKDLASCQEMMGISEPYWQSDEKQEDT